MAAERVRGTEAESTGVSGNADTTVCPVRQDRRIVLLLLLSILGVASF